MSKLKGLGKGLDVLLANSDVSAILNHKDSKGSPDVVVQTLNIKNLQAGKYQPRRIFDDDGLQELSSSIKANGIVQPIIVRLIAKDKYEIIAGERRFRAAKLAGLQDVPVVIRSFTDEEALAVSLIENIQRKDLNVVEEALGYRRLVDEFNLTHDKLAIITGKSRSNISNTLRLLNLSQYVLDMLLNNKLEMGHARALLPLVEDKQIILAQEVVAKKMTTAEVENRVAMMLHEQQFGSLSKIKKMERNPDVARFEETVADKIGMMVAIKHNKSGRGKITISYSSVDELEGFLERIK